MSKISKALFSSLGIAPYPYSYEYNEHHLIQRMLINFFIFIPLSILGYASVIKKIMTVRIGKAIVLSLVMICVVLVSVIVMSMALQFIFITCVIILFVFCYGVGGLIWLKYEARLPMTHQSLAISAGGTDLLFLFIIWPFRIMYLLFNNWKIMFSNERYDVITNKERKYFGSWDEASKYAIKKAFEENEEVMVRDRSKIVKQFEYLQNKSWLVYPDGKIKKLPRTFL